MTSSICRTCLFIPAVVWLIATDVAASEESEPRLAANWRHIYYPEVAIPSAKGQKLGVLVGSDSQSENPKLRFDVIWIGLHGERPPAAMIKDGQTNVRLHLREGTVIDPSNQLENVLEEISMAGETSYKRIFLFPWGPNKLDEAWFELKVEDRSYWIEVPYGFTRDPAALLAPAEPKAGAPALLPAMMLRKLDDRFVSWTKIDFDLGPIQNGWRLLFERVNSVEPRWIVTASLNPWQTDQATIHLKITEDGRRIFNAKTRETRIQDPLRFVTEFAIAGSTSEGRNWGMLEIVVDQRSVKAVIPSSLFKPRHSFVAGHGQWFRKNLVALTEREAKAAAEAINSERAFNSQLDAACSLVDAAVRGERFDLFTMYRSGLTSSSTLFRYAEEYVTNLPASDFRDRIIVEILKSPNGWPPDPDVHGSPYGYRSFRRSVSDPLFAPTINKLLPKRAFLNTVLDTKASRLQLAAELEKVMENL